MTFQATSLLRWGRRWLRKIIGDCRLEDLRCCQLWFSPELVYFYRAVFLLLRLLELLLQSLLLLIAFVTWIIRCDLPLNLGLIVLSVIDVVILPAVRLLYHFALHQARHHANRKKPAKAENDAPKTTQVSKVGHKVVLLPLVEIMHLIGPQVETNQLSIFDRLRPRDPLGNLLAIG